MSKKSRIFWIISFFIGIILLFSFLACQENDGSSHESSSSSSGGTTGGGGSNIDSKTINIGLHNLTIEKPYTFTGTKDTESGSYYAKLGSIIIKDVSVVVFVITSDGYGGQITLNPGTYEISGISEVWAKHGSIWFKLKSEYGTGGQPDLPINAQTPIISSQPVGSTVTINNPFNLSVTALSPDGGTLSYRWNYNTSASNYNGIGYPEDIYPSSYTSIFAPYTGSAGTSYYYVEVTNNIPDNGDGGNKTAWTRSNIVMVAVNDKVNAQVPNITTQPIGGTIIFNGSHNLSVIANSFDNGSLSYQWYSNTSASNADGTVINGATSAVSVKTTASTAD